MTLTTTPRPLTAKQEAFAQAYVILPNASEAYRSAYSTEKMSQRVLWKEASLLLDNPIVTVRIAELQGQLAERHEITQDMIAQEYQKLGFANISDVISWGEDSVTFKASADLSPEITAAVAEVSSIETKEGRHIKLKLHDKRGALDSLAKLLGFMVDRSEVKNLNLDVVATLRQEFTLDELKTMLQAVREKGKA